MIGLCPSSPVYLCTWQSFVAVLSAGLLPLQTSLQLLSSAKKVSVVYILMCTAVQATIYRLPTSSRWMFISIMAGITQERVVNSFPLKREVNLAKGCKRMENFFSVLHSLAAKSSQPCSSNTTFSFSLTSNRRLISRNVELHLVGQSLIYFFPDKAISLSVAFVAQRMRKASKSV